MTVGNNSAEYTYAKSNVMVMKTLAKTIEKIILPASIPIKQQRYKISVINEKGKNDQIMHK